MNRSIRLVKVAACLAMLVAAAPAYAEPSSGQRATAEALFQQAIKLMDEKQFGEACEKLAGSQELDPALGTLLYLADCYEQAGRTASAWAVFREAADVSRRTGQTDRERIAAERAGALEVKLSKLELRVMAGRSTPGFTLSMNGAPVPSASWNAVVPVDPGPMRIDARAPGKKPWSTVIQISEGPASQVVELPKLLDAPAPPKNTAASYATGDLNTGSSQRSVGYVVGAVGVVALAVGGFFGYRAYSQNKDSKARCRADDPNVCTPAGVGLREDAKTSSIVSTIVTAGGGLVVATGITLLVTAPANLPPRRDLAKRSEDLDSKFALELQGVW